VTALSVAVGLCAALAFGLHAFVIGALIYQLSFVLDCVDGKLASAQEQSSRWGGFFDVAADAVRFLTCFIGLAFAIALDGETTTADVVALTLYPSVRFAVLYVGDARPVKRPSEMIAIGKTPRAVWAAAPSRASKPGSTVDTEALVFTLGPAAGLPVVAILAGAAIDLLHLLSLIALGMRESARGSTRTDSVV
jgi:hypothetical protein